MMRFLLVFLSFILLCSTADALPRLEVVTEEWRPYNYLDENGTLIGGATEKVKRVLDKAGVEYEMQVYPWVRALKIARQKPNTLIYSIFRTPERESWFHWGCPLLQPVKEYVFTLKSRKDIKIRTLEDAKQYITSTVRGSVGHDFLVNQGFEAGKNLDVAADASAIPRKLLAGRVDLTMTTEYTMFEALKHIGMSYDLVERGIEIKEVDTNRACFAFNLDSDPALINIVLKALEEDNKDPSVVQP
ncbi:substrate-binding periplasmic protein [Pseudoalteromonas xiamenensis]